MRKDAESSVRDGARFVRELFIGGDPVHESRLRRRSAGEADFLEVHLAGGIADRSSASPFEVTLPNGVTLRVPQDFDVVALTALIRAASSC